MPSFGEEAWILRRADSRERCDRDEGQTESTEYVKIEIPRFHCLIRISDHYVLRVLHIRCFGRRCDDQPHRKCCAAKNMVS